METMAHSDFKCLIRKCLMETMSHYIWKLGDMSMYDECPSMSVVSSKFFHMRHSLFAWKSFPITDHLHGWGGWSLSVLRLSDESLSLIGWCNLSWLRLSFESRSLIGLPDGWSCENSWAFPNDIFWLNVKSLNSSSSSWNKAWKYSKHQKIFRMSSASKTWFWWLYDIYC